MNANAKPFNSEKLTRQEIEASHLEAMRACWPEWDGPAPGMLAEVCSVVVFSIDRQRKWYAYMAPVRLVSEECGAFIAVIEYPHTAPENCLAMNGEHLRLELDDIWPPTKILAKARREENHG